MKITQANWIFLDTETTGIPKAGQPDPSIIELGWVKISNMQVQGTQDFLINPGEPIPPVVQKITHITDEMVANEPRFDVVANKFIADFRSADFIAAYNKDFDRKMLEIEFAKLGAKLPEKTWLDPLSWARFFMNTGDHKLGTIAKEFKVSLENAHRADADATASAEILMKFFQWGVEEAAFPDDVDMLKSNERMWRADANRKAGFAKKIKNNMTGTPGQYAQDIYDNYNRDRLMKLGNRGRWGK